MHGEVETDNELLEQYEPRALYFEEADILEYVRSDGSCVHQRVDGMLTLILDMYSREPVGFALKGFKNLYWQHLKAKHKATEQDFLQLASVLEDVAGLAGDAIFGDTKKAYQRALEIASKDQVQLSEDELPKAA